MAETFYLVWALDGPLSKYKHNNLDAAQHEAERLAASNPGVEFVVMQSLTGYLSPKPAVEKITYDPIPF